MPACSTGRGPNAELQLVDERIVGHKPASLDHAAAASLPLTALTAYEMLFDRMRIPRDEELAGNVLLVIGGAGGVPSIAIQLARMLTRVTAGRDGLAPRERGLGAAMRRAPCGGPQPAAAAAGGGARRPRR